MIENTELKQIHEFGFISCREFRLISERILFSVWLILLSLAVYSQSSGLPLFVIDTYGQEIPDEYKITAFLKVINNGPGVTNYVSQPGTDYEGSIGIEIRGSSSQMFPKQNYSIETRFESGADSSVSLLGMPAESDWVLYGPYSDKSLLRNALTYYLGRSMKRDWQPRYRFCELYLNGEYNGLYMLIEKIKRDKNRVNISKLKPDEISGNDLTGGYIIKVDRMEGVTPDMYFEIIPSNHTHVSENYKIQYYYPKYDEIVTQQKDYIKKLMTDMDNSLDGRSFSDPLTGFRKYIDVSSFVDHQIIQEVCNNVDGYRLSTFFYKDKDSHGGKLHAGPIWDFDLAYANEDYNDYNLRKDIWLYTRYTPDDGNRIHWWARLMEDLSYRSVFVNRWKELRKGSFNTDSVMTFIDSTINYLGPAIDRNFAKWPVIGEYVWPNYFVGSTYEEEVDYLKNWLTGRMDWIDGNIANAANLSTSSPENEILVYPNPVRDQLNLSFYLDFAGEIQIEFFDLTGRKVFSCIFEPEDTGYQYMNLDIQREINPGYYILRLSQGGRFIGRKKIIVDSR
jgi:hypothetical protein